MLKPDWEMIERNKGIVESLVAKLEDDSRRTAFQRLLEGPLGTTFFTAPASSREAFHSCFPGGLAKHTIGVIARLKVLADTLHPSRWGRDTLVTVGLCHDLGKAGDGLHDMYIPTDQDWKSRRGEHYDLNKAIQYMSVPQRALFVLQSGGITLTQEEYLAILLSDGQYVAENKPYAMREPDLAVLLHFADLHTTREENPG